ncbi:MAG: glycosyltransferase family 2 protein [Myxococcota bacterium]|nr:glycosyltransferase family 2 protein [Myxococcota bacterium]
MATLMALALVLPALVYSVENLAALWGRANRGATREESAERPSFAVLVPAHDESGSIAATLSQLKPQLGPGDRLLVVADNCTDDTASIARSLGVEVTERDDADHRGKGFALVHGLDHLDARPPDVVIVLDADCRVGGEGLTVLARRAASLQRPVQAEYLIESPADAGPLSSISAFALLVRNRVRPLGLRALGLPTQLTGSGMAFPWDQIRNAPHLRGHLVEDLVLGIAMAEAGHAPVFEPGVEVRSVLPERLGAASSQRTRWEHGQLDTLLRRGPLLIARGLVGLRADLVGLGLDLVTPPLALLVSLLLGLGALSLGGVALGLSPLPAGLAFAGLGAVGATTLSSWWAFGRDTVPFRTLALVPLYLLWKLPLYFRFLVDPERRWVRTERESASASQRDAEPE